MTSEQPKRYGIPRHAPPPKRQKQGEANATNFDPSVHLAPLLALAPRQDRLELLQREADGVAASLPALSLRVAQLRWRAVVVGSGGAMARGGADEGEVGEEERLDRLMERVAALEAD